MLRLEVALALHAAGLKWHPAPGDHFVVLQAELLDRPFVLSDMTVDVQHFPGGPVIGFNGTTEWALDSVDLDGTVWLPLEHQLREHLGAEFDSLGRVGDDYVVALRSGSRHAGPSAVEAYAAALISQLAARQDVRSR